MAENERDFKGVWIPRTVWLDERLNINEKFYLAIYTQCEKNENKADRIMKQIASTTTICNSKKRLRELNLIEVITDYEQAKSLVLQRKGKGVKCEWCGNTSFAIQEHHYPIPKHKGGKQTVKICPNCHYEYHAILKNEV